MVFLSATANEAFMFAASYGPGLHPIEQRNLNPLAYIAETHVPARTDVKPVSCNTVPAQTYHPDDLDYLNGILAYTGKIQLRQELFGVNRQPHYIWLKTLSNRFPSGKTHNRADILYHLVQLHRQTDPDFERNAAGGLLTATPAQDMLKNISRSKKHPVVSEHQIPVLTGGGDLCQFMAAGKGLFQKLEKGMDFAIRDFASNHFPEPPLPKRIFNTFYNIMAV